MGELPRAIHRHVVALLGDTQGAERIIEWSASLAVTLSRGLGVVSVEDTAALAAASLPFTQVLEIAGAHWAPYALHDVERAYRAQADRLRALAERAAQRHALNWSLHTLRGGLPQLVFDAFAESDLLFLGPLSASHFAQPAAARNPRRRVHLAVACHDGEADSQVVALAKRLADALGAALHVIRIPPDGPATAQALQSGAAHADLLVLPRALASPDNLARLPCPALLVSEGVSELGA